MFLRQLCAEPLMPQVRQDEHKPQGTRHYPSAPPKEKAVRVQTWYCHNNPSVMTLMWNDDYMKTKVRKTPLLPTSRITHSIFPNSDHPLRNITSQALCPCVYLFPTTARDKQQCPTTGHRGHLPPLYEQPESWAGGQIPLNCLFFLSSTPRAGLRQNSRKTSRVPILPGHLHCLLCPASSKTAAFCLGTSTSAALETFSSSSNSLVWERWGHSHASASSGLTEHSLSWQSHNTPENISPGPWKAIPAAPSH